jgi:phosphonate transport system substrate-binding protein
MAGTNIHRRAHLLGWGQVLLGLGAASSGGVKAQNLPSYTVSVVPQFPATDIHRDWVPLLERVGRAVGASFKLQIATSIPRFEADLLAGAPDFVYLNPYHEVMAHRAQGYVPLVRERKPLTGILVVRRDDPIRSVRELDGKELAFPAPNAFGASLYMRALLAEREKIQITPVYVQTHSNVYRQVIRGKSAAGGGVNHTLEQERDELRNDLRVLMETPGVPPHPLAAHPRVPAKLQKALADALLALADDAAGQALLRGIEMPAPVRADYAHDYQPLEALRLDRYVVLPKP